VSQGFNCVAQEDLLTQDLYCARRTSAPVNVGAVEEENTGTVAWGKAPL